MAKTPKSKNNSKASINSRAARRITSSPPADLPKSLSTSTTTHDEPSVLKPHTSKGIIKKKARPKPLKRKQRLRLEAGRDKAENIRERTVVKTIDSKGRGDRKKRRRGNWEDIDGVIGKEVEKEVGRALGRGRKERRRGEDRGGIGEGNESMDVDGDGDGMSLAADNVSKEDTDERVASTSASKDGQETLGMDEGEIS